MNHCPLLPRLLPFRLRHKAWLATERFLNHAWWIANLPSSRTGASIWTPAAFRRRGIYLDRHDLTHDGVTPVPDPLFDSTALRRAFTALADKFQRRNTVGHVHVFGGPRRSSPTTPTEPPPATSMPYSLQTAP